MRRQHLLVCSSLFAGSLLNSLVAQAELVSRANGSMVYDTDKNITWTSNANLFKTFANSYSQGPGQFVQNLISFNNGEIQGLPSVETGVNGLYKLSVNDFDVTTGKLNWYGAMAWAHAFNFKGYSDWRLPTAIDLGKPGCDYANSGSDCGPNPDTSHSELAHLYYDELSRKSNLNPFTFEYQSDFGIFGNGAETDISGDVAPFNNVHAFSYWTRGENLFAPNLAWALSTQFGYQEPINKSAFLYAWLVRTVDVDVATVPTPASVWLFGSAMFGLLAFRKRAA